MDVGMMSMMWEESTGEKADRGGKGGSDGGGVTDNDSERAVDLGDFVVIGEEERVTEVRGGGWVKGRWPEQFVDGGEQDARVLVLMRD